MAAASDYLEQRTIDFWLNGASEFSTTAPGSVYIALFTSATDDSGGGTEVSGGGYARVQVTNGFTAMSGVTDGSTANKADITFPQATADWGTVTHAAIFDAATGGNMLFHAPLAQEKAIGTNDTFKFAAGDLTVTLD